MTTADDLVAEFVKIREHLARETKRFSDYCAPAKARQDAIAMQLMEILNEQGANALKTEHGTAYKSVIVTPKIIDREKYLDAVMDHYDLWGAGMLQLGPPKKEALDDFMLAYNGQLPDGVQTTSYVHVNIRKS